MDRLLLAVLLGTALWFVPASGLWDAGAQEGGVQIVVERPLPGTTIAVQTEVSGWAVNPYATTGTGIDAVHVYLDGEPGPAARAVPGPRQLRAEPRRRGPLARRTALYSLWILPRYRAAGGATILCTCSRTRQTADHRTAGSRAAVAQFEASSIAPGW